MNGVICSVAYFVRNNETHGQLAAVSNKGVPKIATRNVSTLFQKGKLPNVRQEITRQKSTY